MADVSRTPDSGPTLEELTLSPEERERVELRAALMAAIYDVVPDLGDREYERCADRVLSQWVPRLLATRVSVSPITDDMVAKAERVAHEVHEAWRVTANRDAYVGDAIRRAATEALSAALAGCTVGKPTHALVRTRIGVGRSLVSLAYSHDEAVTQVNAARRESELRDYIEIVPIEQSGGSQVGDQHGE